MALDVVSAATAAMNNISLADSTPSAAARVFGIVELLEQILSDLVLDAEIDVEWQPDKRLFALMRVNTAFHAVISNTKAFRKAMWLEAPELKPGEFTDVQHAFGHRFFWLFQQLQNPLDFDTLRLQSEDGVFYDMIDMEYAYKVPDVDFTLKGAISLRTLRIDLLEDDPTSVLSVFLRPEASWRRMLAPVIPKNHTLLSRLQVPRCTRHGPWPDAVLLLEKSKNLGVVCDEYMQLFRSWTWQELRCYA